MDKVQIGLLLLLLALCGAGSVEESSSTTTTATSTTTTTSKAIPAEDPHPIPHPTDTVPKPEKNVKENQNKNSNTLTSTTKPSSSSAAKTIESEDDGNNRTRITRQLQYLYSPYLFPFPNPSQSGNNYPVASGFPIPNPNSNSQQQAHISQAQPQAGAQSPYYAFWSNLQTLPAHYQQPQQVITKTNADSSNPNQGQDQSKTSQSPLFQLYPQFHIISPYQIPSQGKNQGQGQGQGQGQIRTVALPYAQVEHGNIWNFDDSLTPNQQVKVQQKEQLPKRNAASNYYFPFANAQFGAALDEMYAKESNLGSSGSGFQRGHVEARPGVPSGFSAHGNGGYSKNVGTSFHTAGANGLNRAGGFVRAHVEAPPANSNNNNKNRHHQYHYHHDEQEEHNGGHVQAQGLQKQVSFNRGAVEGAPEGFRQRLNSQSQSPHRAKNIDDYNYANGQNEFAIQTGEDNVEYRQKNYYNVGSDKKVVCYFANWAWYRKDKASFVPENIDPMLCTHVIYAFSTFDKANTTIASSDAWTDVTNNFYRRTVALKERNANLKVLLSIGGWADSGDAKYSDLAHSPQGRLKFAQEAVRFLKQYGFDGLAVDWHYPKCWQSNCDAGPSTDSTAFGDLLRVLKQHFQPEGLLLSATLSGYKEVIDLAYHVPTLNELLDLMNVMVYDYHGAWERTTGHVAPLFYGPAGYDHYPYYNANFTMEYYASLGADRSKLIMGIPMYGQTFTLAERINTQVGAEANGAGDAGEHTQQPGMLAYYEICRRVREKGWTVVNDRTASWGPIAYSGNQWVGYDDPAFVARKARYIQSKGFGGAFVWTMDLDDFNNDCCTGSQPLLRTIAKELLNIPYDSRQQDCRPPPAPVTPPTFVTTTFSSMRPTTSKPGSNEYEPSTSTVWWVPPPTTTTTSSPNIWWTSSTATVPSQTTTSAPMSSTSLPVTWWPTTPTTTTTTTTTQETTPSTISPPPFDFSTTPTTTTPSPTTIILTCIRQTTPAPQNQNDTYPQQQPTTSWPMPAPGPGSEVLEPGSPCNSGSFTLEPAHDCASYYQCVYNKIQIRRCSAGLHYNAMAQTCDWPDNARCSLDSMQGQMPSSTRNPMATMPPMWTTSRPQTTTTMTTTRRTTTWAPPPSMTDCTDGDYLPAEDCSSYYLCTMGRKTLQHCGPGLHWDRTRKLCDWPSEAHCQSSPLKLETGLDSAILQRRCAEGTYTPSNADCSMYFVCVHGENVPFTCQGGLHWNQNSKNCDWPSNAGCNLSPGPVDGSQVPGQGGQNQGQEVATMPPMGGPPAIVTMPPTSRPTWTTMSTTMRPPMRPPTSVQGQNEGIKGDFMLVCYFTNWAWYRQGEGKYKPENINENLCTHVVYGFAVLDRTQLTIKVYDGWADLDNKFYEQVTALRAKGIKVSIAIGGWNDSEGDHYSRLVNNPEARARFVRNVIEFIQKYNFDGLDLDWEYPKCWQVNCDKGPDSDKPNFAALVRELKEAFKPYGYLLSAAVSPSKTVIDKGYDVPTLSTYLDWIAVMTYDYHGQWDKKTGHVAPLYFHEEADVSYFNTNYTINYWINQGADRKKIVMGMPLYGQSFTLIDPNNHGLNAPTSGGGNQGRYTKQSGFLAYYEICQHVQREGWTVVQDPSGALGPYAYRGNQWVSYDDVEMIAKKSQLIRDLNIGGGMVWALDLDDFRNVCGQGEYPLLTTIKNVLSKSRYPTPDRFVPVSSPSTAVNIVTNQQKHQQNNQNLINQGQSQSQGQEQGTKVIAGAGQPQPPKRLQGLDQQKYVENDVCDDEPYKPHDKDCNKYYQCIFGRYIEQRCPPGTFWNKDRCDWECGKPSMETVTSRPMSTSRPSETTRPTLAPTQPPFTTQRTTTMTTTRMTTSRMTTPRPTNVPGSSVDNNHPQPPQAPFTPFECPASGKKPDWEPATATETNTAAPVNVPDSEYKMVCYFTNWAWYRPGIGKYKPRDIDFNLCTHIAYGFAVLDGTSLTIRPHDGWADLENKFYRQVVQLKSRGLKIVLAIGGWNDSAGDKYSRLVNNPEARRRFIEHMIEFLEKHCFDGLDLDWEYPKCWQVECNKGPDSDKQGFADLVRELSEAFKPRGLLLSSAVSPSKTVIDLGYDVPTMSKYMDWISVMTYDYHGQWDKKTGHVAPMYTHEDADNVFFNTNYTINYWINQGADRKKIVMGMPMYGQSFTLVNPSENGLNAKTSGGGTAGEFTRQSGFLAYYEICRNILSRDWEVVQDQSGAIGPYAYKGNQWASFDDMNMIRRKSEYIKEMGLGGGMIWALDLDDFRGTCGCGSHPLLKTINRVLRNYPDSTDQSSCKLS